MEQITTQLPAGFTAGQLFDVSLPGRAYVARLAFPANMQAGDTFVFQARRPRDRSRAARFGASSLGAPAERGAGAAGADAAGAAGADAAGATNREGGGAGGMGGGGRVDARAL